MKKCKTKARPDDVSGSGWFRDTELLLGQCWSESSGSQCWNLRNTFVILLLFCNIDPPDRFSKEETDQESFDLFCCVVWTFSPFSPFYGTGIWHPIHLACPFNIYYVIICKYIMILWTICCSIVYLKMILYSLYAFIQYYPVFEYFFLIL